MTMEGWAERPSGLWVPERDAAEETLGCDLFAGAGGFSLGMQYGGIDVVCATDNEPTATMTYLWNLGKPDCQLVFTDPEAEATWDAAIAREKRRTMEQGISPEHDLSPGTGFDGDWIGSAHRASSGEEGGCRGFLFGDVAKVTGDQLLQVCGADRIDVVFGGPPCQGLSGSNVRACLEDPRNGLLWEFMRLVDELRPEVFMMENVPQILTAGKGGLFEGLAAMGTSSGYTVVANILDASNFGVPQYRRRAFIVGSRSGARPFSFPQPSHWPMVRRPDGVNTTMQLSYEQRELHEERERIGHGGVSYDPVTQTWQIADEEEAPEAAAPEPQRDLFSE